MEQETKLTLGKVVLEGNLSIPEGAHGIVLFAHGSGSSRFSPRNQHVASYLNDNNIGTFLIDLLTSAENEVDEVTRQYRFDIPLLAERLEGICAWLKKNKETKGYKVGLFGASTGAAAALIAAADLGKEVSCVVSRGGRVDLASSYLKKVAAPTLFIVGERDEVVLELNKEALELLSCPKKLESVPGATHLFEETGSLEEVARISANWFLDHLR